MDRRLLAIYLNDHLAVLVGGGELVKRMLGSTQDAEIRTLLTQLRPELEESEREVERLLARVGAQPSRLKRAGAWLGEKGGRLKSNGNPRGYSPLTRLVELEGLRAVLDAERSLWTSLARSAAELAEDGDFAQRAERVERRLQQAEALRLGATDVALGGVRGRRL